MAALIDKLLSIYIHENTSWRRILGPGFVFTGNVFEVHGGGIRIGAVVRFLIVATWEFAVISRMIRDKIVLGHLVDPVQGTLAGFAACTGFALLITIPQRVTNPQLIAQVFNHIISLKKHCTVVQPRMEDKLKWMLLICRSLRFSAYCFVPLMASISTLWKPSIPFNVLQPISTAFGEHFIREPPPTHVAYEALKASVTVGCSIPFWILICATGYMGILEATIGEICMIHMLQNVRRRVKSVVNGETGRKELRAWMNTEIISVIRAIQLLASTFNLANQAYFLRFVVVVGTGQILTGFLFLKASSFGLPNLLLPLFSLASMNAGVAILAIYGLAGDVNQESMRCFGEMRRSKVLMKDNYCRRMQKSCRVLKIKFGGSNFIEKTTPLVFETFCLARLVELLLLSKS